MDFDVRVFRSSQSEMHTQIILGDVAATAAYFIHLAVTGPRAINPRSDARAIRFHADSFHFQPVRLRGLIAAKKLWYVVDTVDKHINVPVIVEVAERAAAARRFLQNPRSAIHGDIGEFAVSQVPIQHLALTVSRFGVRITHFWKYMAVADEEIEPAVVIEINEADTPPQKTRVLAEPRLDSLTVE